MNTPKLVATHHTNSALAVALVGLLFTLQSSSADAPRAPAGQILAINRSAKLERFPTENYRVPGKPVPEAADNVAYSASLKTGIFEGEPGSLLMKDWPTDEVVTLISGHLTIKSDSGVTTSFGPGDSFVVPKGFNGVWIMRSKIRELFVLGP